MRRVRIVSNAKIHLNNAKAHRKQEAMNRSFAKSLGNAGDFFGARQFASDAVDSRRLARQEAREARKRLPLWHKAKKKTSLFIKSKARKLAGAMKTKSRKL